MTALSGNRHYCTDCPNRLVVCGVLEFQATVKVRSQYGKQTICLYSWKSIAHNRDYETAVAEITEDLGKQLTKLKEEHPLWKLRNFKPVGVFPFVPFPTCKEAPNL